MPTLSIVSSKDLIGFLFPSGNAMISRSYPLKVSVIGVNELGVRKPFSFPPSLNVELWLFFFVFNRLESSLIGSSSVFTSVRMKPKSVFGFIFFLL